jgi:hypothetical protein
MTDSNMTGPMMAAQRNSNLVGIHSGATKYPRQQSARLVDTSLSSSALSTNSTRHSVTSRIDSNSRPFSYLIFSSRHLNATPENRTNVEKFNTRLRFFAARTRSQWTRLRGYRAFWQLILNGLDIATVTTDYDQALRAPQIPPQCKHRIASQRSFIYGNLLSSPHLVILADCELAIIHIQGRDRDWLSN